jgi:hypothetical protein
MVGFLVGGGFGYQWNIHKVEAYQEAIVKSNQIAADRLKEAEVKVAEIQTAQSEHIADLEKNYAQALDTNKNLDTQLGTAISLHPSSSKPCGGHSLPKAGNPQRNKTTVTGTSTATNPGEELDTLLLREAPLCTKAVTDKELLKNYLRTLPKEFLE